MESDDSYETTSEVSPDRETRFSSSSSHESMNRNSSEIRDLYLSVFSATEPTVSALNDQLDSLKSKVQEQSLRIQTLETDRTKLLEQKIQLYHSLEKKERQLVEVMQLYEEKAKDIAQYMQEVQGLLSQLADFFPENFDERCTKHVDNCIVRNEINGEKAFRLKEGELVEHTRTNGANQTDQKLRDERGRDILRALSASVAAATASNKGATRKRFINDNSTDSKNNVRISGELPLVNGCLNYEQSSPHSSLLNGEGDHQSTVELTPHFPPFCWSTDQVLLWLSDYAYLPNGCLQAAKECKLDGKQLTLLSDSEAQRLLHLTDAGLRRKFRLALEDLRVHGSPGISRFPGPSHVGPDWICKVWLNQHLGLAHLIPFFTIRRVDGRMLASLAVSGLPNKSTWKQNNKQTNSVRLISSPHELSSNGFNICDSPTSPNAGDLTNDISRGASRKEINRILMGFSADKSSEKLSVEGLSGADLPVTVKSVLGKNEVRSLRAGLELLRWFNFDIELLERTRKGETYEDRLLLWTNESIAKWLEDIGLRGYTHGFNMTGIHGAYLALDPSFTLNRLMKLLKISPAVAVKHNLDERFEELMKRVRLHGGSASRHRRTFRRRSTSRSTHTNIMQRSTTSSSNLELSGSSSPMISGSKLENLCLSNNVIPTESVKSRRRNIVKKSSWLGKNNTTQFEPKEQPSIQKFDTNEEQHSNNCMSTTKNGKYHNKPFSLSSELHNRRTSRLLNLSCPVLKQSESEKSASDCRGKDHGDLSEETDRSNTLVRKIRTSPVAELVKSPLMRKLVGQKSPSPVNSPAKASDVPMIDPFDQNVGQPRTRILLFKKPDKNEPETLTRVNDPSNSEEPTKSHIEKTSFISTNGQLNTSRNNLAIVPQNLRVHCQDCDSPRSPTASPLSCWSYDEPSLRNLKKC